MRKAMERAEAINVLLNNFPTRDKKTLCDAYDIAINAIRGEIQQIDDKDREINFRFLGR